MAEQKVFLDVDMESKAFEGDGKVSSASKGGVRLWFSEHRDYKPDGVGVNLAIEIEPTLQGTIINGDVDLSELRSFYESLGDLLRRQEVL